MKKIIVMGSSNTDLTLKVENFPLPGQTVPGEGLRTNQGGKGANQAVAVARLGIEPAFICRVGDDEFGKKAREAYRLEGIDTGYVYVHETAPTGVAVINVDRSGENTIVVAAGANMLLSPADVDQAQDLFDGAEYLLMQLEVPIETVVHAARMARDKGVKVILNPAPFRDIPAQLWEYVDLIIPNQTEASLITGTYPADEHTAIRVCEAIADKGPQEVIITMGSSGAVAWDGTAYHVVTGIKADPVDTTGAGDTFCGALCVGLAEGMSLAEATVFANKAAAVSVTRNGAQPSIPYRHELE